MARNPKAVGEDHGEEAVAGTVIEREKTGRKGKCFANFLTVKVYVSILHSSLLELCVSQSILMQTHFPCLRMYISVKSSPENKIIKNVSSGNTMKVYFLHFYVHFIFFTDLMLSKRFPR